MRYISSAKELTIQLFNWKNKDQASCIDTGLNKPSNNLSTIAEHLLNNYVCAKIVMEVTFIFELST